MRPRLNELGTGLSCPLDEETAERYLLRSSSSTSSEWNLLEEHLLWCPKCLKSVKASERTIKVLRMALAKAREGDRRDSRREGCRIPVVASIDGSEATSVVLINQSNNGFCIAIPKQLEVGQRIRIDGWSVDAIIRYCLQEGDLFRCGAMILQ